MKKVVYVMFTLLLAFSITGCSSSDSNKKEEKTEFTVGEVATIDDVEYTVVAISKHQGDNPYIKPAEGKEYVTVSIKIENKSDDKVSYNPLDWKMVNSSGQEDGSAIMANDSNTNLSSGDLTAGGIVEGTITFEEPIGDTGLKLNYYNNMFEKEAKCSFIIG